MPKDTQNYYWLFIFSSSAQSISAFIAFLIAGYAIVLNVLDTLEDKDETLGYPSPIEENILLENSPAGHCHWSK
jgi:hypothetical protein